MYVITHHDTWLVLEISNNELVMTYLMNYTMYNICKMMQKQDDLWISSSFPTPYFHHLKFKVWPSQAEAFSQSHKLENLNWNPYKWVETMDKYRLCVNLLNANSGHTGNNHLAHHPSPSSEHSSDTSPPELFIWSRFKSSLLSLRMWQFLTKFSAQWF